jgi:hypothetical protein
VTPAFYDRLTGRDRGDRVHRGRTPRCGPGPSAAPSRRPVLRWGVQALPGDGLTLRSRRSFGNRSSPDSALRPIKPLFRHRQAWKDTAPSITARKPNKLSGNGPALSGQRTFRNPSSPDSALRRVKRLFGHRQAWKDTGPSVTERRPSGQPSTENEPARPSGPPTLNQPPTSSYAPAQNEPPTARQPSTRTRPPALTEPAITACRCSGVATASSPSRRLAGIKQRLEGRSG